MLEKELLKELQEYVDSHLIEVTFEALHSQEYVAKQISEDIFNNEIEDFIKNKRKPTFSQVLIQLIDESGDKDSTIYKRAGVDRRHFSKIRSNPEYRPSKNTVIALAFALKLTKHVTAQLLGSAGYSLSESETFDLVIQFCLEKEIYSLLDVNEALDYFSLKPIGC